MLYNHSSDTSVVVQKRNEFGHYQRNRRGERLGIRSSARPQHITESQTLHEKRRSCEKGLIGLRGVHTASHDQRDTPIWKSNPSSGSSVSPLRGRSRDGPSPIVCSRRA
ncbi:hypothetical protein WOLCODRAFT_23828 [Wolfiporia cocos MD-104 SS10]|uniref:Uncharacterized protein n=1 Tax=Wolfiporia cocos (strain MD-104) TaxID=742152 RepID=A0A2H3JMP9_WOLCO|nr:hypothetical protein WOLCODRAFT_23828 [Wolfiporia cocos MD-104 SS10]